MRQIQWPGYYKKNKNKNKKYVEGVDKERQESA